jgi:hypothetical protein
MTTHNGQIRIENTMAVARINMFSNNCEPFPANINS